eukprot:g3568.t1
MEDPSLTKEWFVTHNGQQFGPVSLDDLKYEAERGELNPRLDMVWKNGMEDWIPSGDIEGLFEKNELAEKEEKKKEEAAAQVTDFQPEEEKKKRMMTSKETDEKLAASLQAAKAADTLGPPVELWCLHGAVGAASDWRAMAKALAEYGISTRAVDLWRFLQCESVSMPDFGKRLNADAAGEVSRGQKRVLLGYSMGGRLALHALLEGGPWDAAVIISANPGLRDAGEASTRRGQDTVWATQALTLPWSDFLEKWNAQAILGGAMRDEREDKKLIQRRREIARSFVDWSVANQEPLWARLEEIKIPLLWIAGENDGKFREMGNEAAAMAGSAEFVIAPECGHRVPWESGDWLAATLRDWLATV